MATETTTMLLRRLIPALFVAPLFAMVAPRAADACSPPIGFTVERTFPAADAVGVGRGINIVVVGQGWPGAQVEITVSQDGAPIDGTMYAISDGRYTWDPGDTLLPETVYDVRVESDDDGVDPPLAVHEFSFTTSPKLSGSSVAPSLTSAVVEVYEHEIKECVVEGDMGSCESCKQWKVIEVEQRLRLVVEVEQPVGRYDGFYGSVLAWAVAPEVVFGGPDDVVFQGPEAGPTRHAVDLAPVGQYPGWQVCLDVTGVDPVDNYIIIPGQVNCIDVRELNIDPDASTDGSDSDDMTPTSGDGSGGASGDESGDGLAMDGDEAGCGCRSSTAPGGSLVVLVLGFGLVRSRRRAR